MLLALLEFLVLNDRLKFCRLSLPRGKLFPFDQFPDAKFQDTRAVLFSNLFLGLDFASFTAVEAEAAGEQ